MDLVSFGSLVASLERLDARRQLDLFAAVGNAFGGGKDTKEWIQALQTAGQIEEMHQNTGADFMRKFGKGL